MCGAGAAALVSSSNRFSLGVLQRMVAHLRVVTRCFGSCGCRSHWNGCMIGVTLCCHVHNAAKRIVMAAWMLHGACVGEKAGARNLVFLSPCTFTPLTQGNHFVRDPGVNLTNIHGWGFTKWAGHQAWCDFPANTGEPPPKKIGSLQNGCPKLISRPQTQSSYKLVS